MEQKIFFPYRLISNLEGYRFIGELCLYKLKKFERLIFDFSNTRWIDANLSSPLASIIFELSTVNTQVKFQNVSNSIQDILNRNQFARQFMNGVKNTDYRSTTIACSRFTLDDMASFQKFIDNELLSREGFPRISDALKRKINKSILEIFTNAHIHGECDCIYLCGQYYPTSKKLHFTISDMGITIRKKVNDFLKSKINGAKAIAWAVEEGNTTRNGPIPGGLGFSLIRDFIKLNGGSFEIVSSDGFWHEDEKNSITETIESRFLGTIVNMKFNLADKNSYILASELNPAEIL